MPVYQRRTRIAAPFERVQELHSDVPGLEALAPAWVRLDIESVRDPDGDNDSGKLATGTEIEMSIRPLGAGPRQRWTLRVLDHEAGETTAWLRDDMANGPFSRWVHTRRPVTGSGETIVENRVKYKLPFSPLGDLADVFGDVGFEGILHARHAEMERLLEKQQPVAWESN